MSEQSNRAIVVTGASTGIGRAIAEVAARNGAHVFAGVRKQNDADTLKAALGARVTPLLFDVADAAAVGAAAAEVAAALGNRRLFGLVNNAGIAVAGPLLHLSAEELRRQMEINFIGVHQVTQAFAPILGADLQREGAPGRIVMMSSVGGRFAQPFFGPYAASKFALEGYSDALRREVQLFGIDVIVIGPGAIKTPIWDKAEAEDFSRFDNTPFRDSLMKTRDFALKTGAGGLPPERVGALVWRVLTRPNPKTRYAIMRNPLANDLIPRLLPPRMVDRIAARTLGLARK